MSLQTATRHPLFLRSFSRPATVRPILWNARYYAQDTAATAADGASGKKPEEAEPKILKRAPPKEEDLPEDVKQHNEEVDKRAGKLAGKAAEKEAAKDDKVSKDFWGGKGGEGGM